MHHCEVALVVRVLQVGVERKKLVRRQHALIDQNSGIQAAYIHQVIRVFAFCAADERFPGYIEPVVKAMVAGRPAADDNLFDEGHGREGGRADISFPGPDGDFPEAKRGNSLLGQCGDQAGFEVDPFGRILRQKEIAECVAARLRQRNAKFFGDPGDKLVWDGGHDAGAIPRILFEATAAAVVHSGVDQARISQDFMTGYALDVSHKANTAGILFHGGVVQALLSRKSDSAVNSSVLHAFNSLSGALTNRRVIRPLQTLRAGHGSTGRIRSTKCYR